jgi:hypothetical protein
VSEGSIDLLLPFDAEEMTAWKVGKAVGDVKNDSQSCRDCVSRVALISPQNGMSRSSRSGTVPMRGRRSTSSRKRHEGRPEPS